MKPVFSILRRWSRSRTIWMLIWLVLVVAVIVCATMVYSTVEMMTSESLTMNVWSPRAWLYVRSRTIKQFPRIGVEGRATYSYAPDSHSPELNSIQYYSSEEYDTLRSRLREYLISMGWREGETPNSLGRHDPSSGEFWFENAHFCFHLTVRVEGGHVFVMGREYFGSF